MKRLFAVAACLALLAAASAAWVEAARAGGEPGFKGAPRADAAQRRKKSRAWRRKKIVREQEGGAVGGVWGGAHVRLSAREGGAALAFDCARGEITAPFKTDAEGRFDLPGTYTREAVSIRIGKTPAARPARYSGRVEGQAMTLVVKLTDTDQSPGTYTLARGSEGRLWKCR
ncbi:MAG: hypothetical protein ABR554_07340 [Pyrinomonadaceae bacterium]